MIYPQDDRVQSRHHGGCPATCFTRNGPDKRVAPDADQGVAVGLESGVPRAVAVGPDNCEVEIPPLLAHVDLRSNDRQLVVDEPCQAQTASPRPGRRCR